MRRTWNIQGLIALHRLLQIGLLYRNPGRFDDVGVIENVHLNLFN